MLLLSFGIPKSGTTLGFELARGILREAGHDQRMESPHLASHAKVNFATAIDRESVAALIAASGPDRIVAVKTHAGFDASLTPWLEAQIAVGDLAVQAIYRDPRETCLSLIDAGERARKRGRPAFSQIETMDDAIAVVATRLELLRRWGGLAGAQLLPYERIAFDMRRSIKAMRRHLGVRANWRAVRRYVQNEAFTQKNRAVRARWRSDLDPAENARLLTHFGPFIRRVCERGDLAWFREAPAGPVGLPSADLPPFDHSAAATLSRGA